MMNVIYLDVDAVHINPTATRFSSLVASAFPEAIDASLRVDRGGQSRSPFLDVLQRVAGSSDDWIVILGPGIPMVASARREVEAVSRYLKSSCVTRSTSGEIVEYLDEVNRFLGSREGKGLLIASGLNFDYYAATADQVRDLREEGVVLVTPGAQFVRPMKQLPESFAQERHYVRKQDRLTDTWRDWLLRYPQKSISAVHFVGQDEFPRVPWSRRKREMEVPGVNYVARRQARDALRRNGQFVSRNYTAYGIRAAARFGMQPFSFSPVMRRYQHVYRKRLSRTKIAYVGPGVFGLPVRKYFEVPAAGALMICTPCEGIKDLGFAHEDNCLIGDPETVPSLAREWTHSAEAPLLAGRGLEMVIRRHGISARASQIRSAVEAILDGSYAGSHWHRGEFVIDRR